MICIKADIPKELNEIDDELKAIYHSNDTVCFYIFKTTWVTLKNISKTMINATPYMDQGTDHSNQECF